MITLLVREQYFLKLIPGKNIFMIKQVYEGIKVQAEPLNSGSP